MHRRHPRSTHFPYTTPFRSLGINLGQPAGAGVPDHFHFHVVPRWAGDTNFMTVLAEVRLIPEDLRRTVMKLVSRSEEHTSELQSHLNIVCRLLLEQTKYIFC